MKEVRKFRIAILGMGGVGGYIGGTLAAAANQLAEVIFIARNQTLKILKKNGLKLITDAGERMVYADLVSDDPAEIGKIDLLICSVKGYDLEESLRLYADCLKPGSIILPFLNGIGIGEKVQRQFPLARIWKGCIYIIARQQERGVIRQSGPVNQLYFGANKGDQAELHFVEDLFRGAGLKADVAADIDEELWKKFFFISVMATITSYYDTAIGEAQQDAAKTASIRQLLDELTQVAEGNHIVLPAGLAAATFQRIMALPPDTTSSMYADFQKIGKTELEELTGEVVRLGHQFDVATPGYEKMYKALRNRNSGK